ncbi:hypothetical protein BDV29DRAFT_182060 [Aspergillus leporis]|uniref:Gag1-like clamp domain-containing protein n=1 Tax=Aspergillus leporis TaxID=41062 RepID=A0A5N5WRU2_9EURO|nr:hypothetical protein BDV29DRAFT_182060 [Aspergillus leporis]
MTTEARDSAIRDAKRYVRDIVRNDWTFQPSSDTGAPASVSPPLPEQEVTEWRLRIYDSSGSELEPLSSPTLASPASGYDSAQLESPNLSWHGEERSERRRKRRRQMEEEMRWNEGLRTWVERRDAWTGARPREEIVARRQQRLAQEVPSRPLSSASEDANAGDLASRTEASLSIAEKDGSEVQPAAKEQNHKDSTETGITEAGTALRDATATTATTTTIVDATTPAPAPATAAATAIASSVAHQGSEEDPFIPVVPSLISTSNPIRASITPSMYPSIYSKVVVQGLTPTVPINLADVTKAMVQGWKSDGQWPPKPATTSIVLQDTATVPKIQDAQASGEAPPSPESKRRSGVASAVRKVLHFSGFHPHPFHRRSSHGGHQHEGDVDGAVNIEHLER